MDQQTYSRQSIVHVSSSGLQVMPQGKKTPPWVDTIFGNLESSRSQRCLPGLGIQNDQCRPLPLVLLYLIGCCVHLQHRPVPAAGLPLFASVCVANANHHNRGEWALRSILIFSLAIVFALMEAQTCGVCSFRWTHSVVCIRHVTTPPFQNTDYPSAS
jgi:hypothetical protein